jgi:hypothetical protein
MGGLFGFVEDAIHVLCCAAQSGAAVPAPVPPQASECAVQGRLSRPPMQRPAAFAARSAISSSIVGAGSIHPSLESEAPSRVNRL